MPRTKTKKTKTLCLYPNKEEVYDNKRCILLWNRDEYGLSILTMKNAKGSELYEKPIFYIPLRTFMRCGAFWSALHLHTVFWEPKPYNIERNFQETERTKGAYLIEFAPDIAPICKGGPNNASKNYTIGLVIQKQMKRLLKLLCFRIR